MKNKILRITLLISSLLILLLPFKSVFADVTHTQAKITKISEFTTNTGGYYISSRDSSAYTPEAIFVHTINDNGTIYSAYCLEVFKSAYSRRTGNITISNSGIINRFGEEITGRQLELLQNILATGYYTEPNGNTATQKYNGMSSDDKVRLYATQILIWEVMDKSRTGYDDASYSNSKSPSSLQYVRSDATLSAKYNEILSEAKLLSSSNKPSSFRDAPYILHWNDGSNAYVSTGISIGEYNVGDYNKTLLNVDKVGSNINVSSNTQITTPEKINFYITKGPGLDEYNTLRKFTFSEGPDSNQKIILAYYKAVQTGELSVKTESGKFNIAKSDSTTQMYIKGATFDIYKCINESSCNEKISTVEIKDKGPSEDITINKSGLYLFKETTVPFGYEKLQDFYVTLNIDDNGKVTAQTDNSHVRKNPNKQDQLELVITNDVKYFDIKKIDGRTNDEIKGTTFKIKKSDGTIVKFIQSSDGKYRYDDNGTITDLVSSNLSTYSISLLPVGEYILEEIAVPKPYVLSSNQSERETKFRIVDSQTSFLEIYNYNSKNYNPSANLTITVKNFETRVTIIKHGQSNKIVPGVTFELYDSKKENQIITTLINGEYVYSQAGTPTQLVTDSTGKIVISQLPEGTYYLKETTVPDDSGLAIDPNNQWTEIKIYVKRDSATPYNYQKEIRNGKGEFCFYKIDEDGKYLTLGKFKLQKYNEKTSRYDDVAIKLANDNAFRIDDTSNLYTFSPLADTETCFREIDAKGRYRIVEIEAPKGYVLPSSSEAQAEIIINEYGYAIGDALIINKKQTVSDGAQAKAELLINIQTGQTRIRYIIIIGTIIAIITGLLFLKKKTDKK